MDGEVVYWNKSAERLTGWSAEEMMGEKARDELYNPSKQETLHECQETVLAEGEWTGELRQQTKDGDELIVESRWTLVRDHAGKPTSISGYQHRHYRAKASGIAVSPHAAYGEHRSPGWRYRP